MLVLLSLQFSGNRFIAASKAQPAQIKREQAIGQYMVLVSLLLPWQSGI